MSDAFVIGSWNQILVELVNNEVTMGVDGLNATVSALGGSPMVNLTLQNVYVAGFLFCMT